MYNEQGAWRKGNEHVLEVQYLVCRAISYQASQKCVATSGGSLSAL